MSEEKVTNVYREGKRVIRALLHNSHGEGSTALERIDYLNKLVAFCVKELELEQRLLREQMRSKKKRKA